MTNVLWFSHLGMGDLDQVGGKNASLGEMISNLAASGVRVPDGFATTAGAYRRFIAQEGLAQTIVGQMADLDTEDVMQLADVGRRVREAIVTQPLPQDVEDDIRAAYDELVAGDTAATFAVRSSATAEDLPDASFAGQQETFLNVRGIEAVLQAVREVFASLYNDRAIAYRVHHGFEHETVALSVGVQRMVRSRRRRVRGDVHDGHRVRLRRRGVHHLVLRAGRGGGAGRGEPGRVLRLQAGAARRPSGDPASAAWGARRPRWSTPPIPRSAAPPSSSTSTPRSGRLLSLADAEVEELARHALVIEEHYGRPMDIEWGKDGIDGGSTSCRRGPRP